MITPHRSDIDMDWRYQFVDARTSPRAPHPWGDVRRERGEYLSALWFFLSLR